MADHKDEGNQFFLEKKYDQALTCYSRAIVSLHLVESIGVCDPQPCVHVMCNWAVVLKRATIVA